MALLPLTLLYDASIFDRGSDVRGGSNQVVGVGVGGTEAVI